MSDNQITKATPADAGCYVDGHWGQYAVAHMVNRAEEFGYGAELTAGQTSRLTFLEAYCAETGGRMGVELADELDALRAQRDAREVIDLADRHLASMGPSDAPMLTDDEHEALSDASDEVEQWLNDHVAPEGYSFGWWEGEFYLWSDAMWEDPLSDDTTE